MLVVTACLALGTPTRSQQDSERERNERGAAHVYTNDDLPAALPVPGGSSAGPDEGSNGQEEASLTIPSYSGFRDRDGHGEGWWRLRAAELDLRIIAARLDAQRLHVAFVKGETLVDPSLPSRSRAATRHLRDLEAERERLPEKLRLAGGLPGWLRRGDRPPPTGLLPPPALREPAGGEALLFSWEAVPRAAFYVVELRPDECGRLVGECDTLSLDVSEPKARFPLEAGPGGQWRVIALDKAGFPGEWSSWTRFERLIP